MNKLFDTISHHPAEIVITGFGAAMGLGMGATHLATTAPQLAQLFHQASNIGGYSALTFGVIKTALEMGRTVKNQLLQP